MTRREETRCTTNVGSSPTARHTHFRRGVEDQVRRAGAGQGVEASNLRRCLHTAGPPVWRSKEARVPAPLPWGALQRDGSDGRVPGVAGGHRADEERVRIKVGGISGPLDACRERIATEQVEGKWLQYEIEKRQVKEEQMKGREAAQLCGNLTSRHRRRQPTPTRGRSWRRRGTRSQ